MTRCLLTEDFDKTRYEVEVPLTCKVDFSRVRKELGIPSYVDSSNFLIERGLVTIWAAQDPTRLREFGASPLVEKMGREYIPVLFFGGGAVKLLSKTANDHKSPLCRDIGDIDLISSKKQGQNLYKLLLVLGELLGTRYYHFTTFADQRFNALQVGQRYRVRAIDRILDQEKCTPGTLDIFVDQISLRHRVNVRDAFEHPKDFLYTIGPTNILLAKCQYILDSPRSDLAELAKSHLEYRVLSYPHYREDKILVGIEEKDIKDICAILLDYDVGKGPKAVDTDALKSVLGKDKKFALTFRLNLESVLRNEKLLREMGLPAGSIEKIFQRTNSILATIPAVDKKWNNPWWNEDVETPKIFGKVNQTVS